MVGLYTIIDISLWFITAFFIILITFFSLYRIHLLRRRKIGSSDRLEFIGKCEVIDTKQEDVDSIIERLPKSIKPVVIKNGKITAAYDVKTRRYLYGDDILVTKTKNNIPVIMVDYMEDN